MTSPEQPERSLIAELERSSNPCLPSLRQSLAVGGLALGRLTLSEASHLAGMTSERLEQIVPASSVAAPVPAAPTGPSDPGSPPLLSVVIAVLDEQDNVTALHEQLSEVLSALGTHEIIFVDDGSRDATAAVIMALRTDDPSVRLLRLSRNFGHQAALSAGLDHARGDAVVLMDGDLQDPPHLVTELVEQWRAGNHVVYAVRKKRQEGVFKRSAYFVFYRLFSRLAQMEVPLDAGDYCLIDRKVADVLRNLPERHRFLRGLRSWAGFRQVGVPYERPARHAGQPKYTLRRLVALALDGLLAFSSVPLHLASYLGFFTAAAGVAYILIAVFYRLFAGYVPAGWTSIIAIVLTVGGAQLMLTGVLGEYLARVYDETKGRPLYIVDQAYGFGGHTTPGA